MVIPIYIFTRIDASTASSSAFQLKSKSVHDHAGIRVHVRLESAFTMRWKPRSPCAGIITEAARRGGDYSSHLWVTVLSLLYGSGLRRGELERLNLDSLDRNEGTLRIDGRKTGRERCVPLPEMVLQCLESYLPRRHNQLERAGRVGEHALLVTRSGMRLSGGAVSNGIHAISRRAGVSIHSMHQFRHTCASDLLEAGVHLAQVQRILGHSGIATTVRYVHIADPQRREAMRLHPLNDMLTALEVAA